MFEKFPTRMVLGAAAWVLLLVVSSRAQSISPVIVEYREKARGSFTLSNDTVYPLDVVLEAFSFSVDERGQPLYRPLDHGIQVRFSETSFRLGPRQNHVVFYEATAEVLPAWFTIYATVAKTGSHTPFRVAYQLPHTVYLLSKRNLERTALVVRRAEADRNGDDIELEVENCGEEFGRVLEVEEVSGSQKKILPGFPFFPHQKRLLVLDRSAGQPPWRVILKFANFKVETAVFPAQTSP